MSRQIVDSGKTKKICFQRSVASEFLRKRDRLSPRLLAFITRHSEDEHNAMNTKFFLSEDGLCGFGINPDGLLLSLFSLIPGRGKIVASSAVKNGATRLDCLGEHLRALYESVGFIITFQCGWNNELAPSHWDYERFGFVNYYEMALPK